MEGFNEKKGVEQRDGKYEPGWSAKKELNFDSPYNKHREHIVCRLTHGCSQVQVHL